MSIARARQRASKDTLPTNPPLSGKRKAEAALDDAPAEGSKTLLAGNLPLKTLNSDLVNFFGGKDGGVVHVRLDVKTNFTCFGYVEFDSVESAQRGLKLNGKTLIDRPILLYFARQRSGPAHTIFVDGFDSSLNSDEIRRSLEKHFSSCGEITRISITLDCYKSGDVKGTAKVQFKEAGSLIQALELNGSDLSGYSLVVKKAK
ncbi:hypothetical protein ACFE04_007444 [Oxalis oulophora]